MKENKNMFINIEKYSIKNLKLNEEMKNHTSFRVGGTVDIFIEPENVEELIRAVSILRNSNITYHLIGNGSNLLVSDKGIRGAVIKLGDKFNKVEIINEEIIAECGVLLSILSKTAAKNTLTGFEFASGIPGTLGGAIAMNAGAYGGEMKDVVKWVEALDENLQIIRYENEQMLFGYRKSIVEKNSLIVVKCSLQLRKGKQECIDEIMTDLAIKRKTKQPLHLPSAGSTFKRPEGYFAAKLIEDAGLKGFVLGGAQVSPLHSGFIVNVGDAAAQDIFNLIRYVQKIVYEKFNIMLETEVKLLGEF